MIIRLNTQELPYDVIIDHHFLNNLNDYLEINKKHLFVIDKNIDKSFLTFLNKDSLVIYFESNERNKNFVIISRIIDFLFEHNFNRDDYIVSIGGGITSDVVGFAASIYKRGINWISIPTTTLAMIDASIGGKTAINYQETKNIIGSFYCPSKVLIDLEVLKTLDKRHYYNGLCEALKMGITLDKHLLPLLEKPFENIDEIIVRSIKVKNQIVEKDFKDHNVRHVLNYGHTFGHALELSNENILHGEAIINGMLYVSSKNIQETIEKYMQKFSISKLEKLPFDGIEKAILQDKKINNERFKVILVDDIEKYYSKDMNLKDLAKLYEGR